MVVISCIGTDLEQKFASDEVQVIDAAGSMCCRAEWTCIRIWIWMSDFRERWMIFMMERWQQPVAVRRSIVDHMAFGPAGCNLHHQLNEYHRLADDKAVIDYGFHGTVQHVNDEILDELESMVEDGVPSVKAI